MERSIADCVLDHTLSVNVRCVRMCEWQRTHSVQYAMNNHFASQGPKLNANLDKNKNPYI